MLRCTKKKIQNANSTEAVYDIKQKLADCVINEPKSSLQKALQLLVMQEVSKKTFPIPRLFRLNAWAHTFYINILGNISFLNGQFLLW